MTYNINLTSLEQEFGTTGYIVGFANKFYTLWNYQITVNEATKEKVFDAYFVKNIGLENPYEGAYPFDANLKGVTLHIVFSDRQTGLQLTPQEFKALKFSAGSQKGLFIADSIDLSGLCWKYNTKFVGKNLSEARRTAELTNICNRAIELGAQLIEDRLWTPKQIDTTVFSCKPMFDDCIANCEDVNLLCWKYNNQAVFKYRPQSIIDGELANIKVRALELGSIEFEGRLYSPDKQLEPWFLEMVATKSSIEKNEPIHYTPKYNVSVEGRMNIAGNTFQFEYQYYPATYYGQEHSFILDAKGKAKQIKNKTIEITSYEKIGENLYKVNSWKFVK